MADDDMRVGGILVQNNRLAPGRLVYYRLSLEAPPRVLFPRDPSFDRAVDDVERWLGDCGHVAADLNRCDGAELGEIVDASAQVALAFGWRALLAGTWYAPLLRVIVISGSFADLRPPVDGVPDMNQGFNPTLGGLKEKLDAYRDTRVRLATGFKLLVLPRLVADPRRPDVTLDLESVPFRISTVAHMSELERVLIEMWSRAAFRHLRHPWVVLRFVLGNWWSVALPAGVVAIWYLVPASAAIDAVAWVGVAAAASVLLLWEILRRESRRLDERERGQQPQVAYPFEDLLDLPDPVPAEAHRKAWAAMLRRVDGLVAWPAARMCRWAADEFDEPCASSQRAMSSLPTWRKRSLAYQAVWPIVIVLTLLLYGDPGYVLAEALRPTGRVFSVKFRGLSVRDGPFADPKRDARGALLLEPKGDLQVVVSDRRRNGRRVRVSCNAPTGRDARDRVVPSAGGNDECLLGPERLPSVIRDVPAGGEIALAYTVDPSPQAIFNLAVELVTRGNRFKDKLSERIRWDPARGSRGDALPAQ